MSGEALVVGQADDQAVRRPNPRSAGLSEPSRVAASKATGSIEPPTVTALAGPVVGDRGQAVRGRRVRGQLDEGEAGRIDQEAAAGRLPDEDRRALVERSPGSVFGRTTRTSAERTAGSVSRRAGQVVGAQGDEVRAVVDRQDGLDGGLARPGGARRPRPARGTRRPAKRRRRRSRGRSGPAPGRARARVRDSPADERRIGRPARGWLTRRVGRRLTGAGRPGTSRRRTRPSQRSTAEVDDPRGDAREVVAAVGGHRREEADRGEARDRVDLREERRLALDQEVEPGEALGADRPVGVAGDLEDRRPQARLELGARRRLGQARACTSRRSRRTRGRTGSRPVRTARAWPGSLPRTATSSSRAPAT